LRIPRELYKNTKSVLSLLQPEIITLTLKGKTKETVVNELLDILETNGKLFNRAAVLKDLMDREKIMSTAIPNGIAIPRAKTTAIQELTATLGIKKSGVDFDSALDDKTNIIILALSPYLN
jgi:mannitol/fructose-specific phosphotransferase system IIA component (Ntr-type)